MDWLDLLNGGGAWVLALAIGWAVLTGRLRLDREVTKLEGDKTKLEADNTKLETKLDSQNDTLAKNTAALETSASSQQTMATLMGEVLPTMRRLEGLLQSLPDDPAPSSTTSKSRTRN